MNSSKSKRPSNLLYIGESQAKFDKPMTGIGIWRLGFRPFYLGGALFTIFAMLMWLSVITNTYTLPQSESGLAPLLWHAHEMIFGFGLAIIAGFLLTASNNWTGHVPAAGIPLATLFSLWAIARVFFALGHILIAGFFDLLFVTLLSIMVLRVFWLAKLWKNLPILLIVAGLGSLNLLFYGSYLGWFQVNSLFPMELALLLIMQLLVVMGGRVIPMFTKNGILGLKITEWPPVIRSITTISFIAILAWIWMPPRIAASLCFLASTMTFIRFLGWKPWRALKSPMVWILQLGYLWIAITFSLLALERLDIVIRSLPLHSLGVGAMGAIMMGMMTRTAMGHTGRQIRPSYFELTSFLLIATSGIARVMAIYFNDVQNLLLITAGICWALAFVFYLVRYTPWLVRPRIDGKPG